jgi:hypothetical protein
MIIPLLIGLGVGGVGAYAVTKGRCAVRQIELERRLKAAATKALGPAAGGTVPTPIPQDPYRPPDAGAVINVPVDTEDFAQLAEAFCVCFTELKAESGADPSLAELRECFLQALYPDFQWPPVPGDPATAHLMWMIADHEARKLLADPSVCGASASFQPHDQEGQG